MPTAPRAGCRYPGCPARADRRGLCAEHQLPAEHERHRPSADQRGYDHKWRRNRARFLAAHPSCLDCGTAATVADHAPVTRAELLRRGDPHPDAWHHLEPRCASCHSRRTASTSPGWGVR